MMGETTSRIRMILVTVIIGFVAMMLYFVITAYKNSLTEAENTTLMRLAGIVNSMALQIDGDAHQHLSMAFLKKDDIKSNTQDSIYRDLHQVLKKNYEANMLHTPIYTIIYDTLSSSYVFGVTSSEKPYYRHTYNSAPKVLMEKHYEGAMIPMYRDEFGAWLSAFSVIKNKRGEVVALVQADEKFDDFLLRARQNAWKNSFISIGVFTIFLLILLRILQPILKREQRDKEVLAEVNTKISQLDNFRKEMIANLSHDLRTPMASIMGFAETLSNQKIQLSDNEREKYLKIILIESKRLNSMVGELFDLSKLEAGQITLNLEPFHIPELAHDILYKYSEVARERNIRLLTEIDEHLPLVYADLRWIDRVLQNLMDNAIKYADEGGIVKFTVSTIDEKVHFKVCNSGKGIAAEHIPHVFDRYFKATSTRKDSTGLGLAIVKKVIDLHQEKVWCEVRENLTTFRFTMKVYQKS